MNGTKDMIKWLLTAMAFELAAAIVACLFIGGI
jgi:hypothetical protein